MSHSYITLISFAAKSLNCLSFSDSSRRLIVLVRIQSYTSAYWTSNPVNKSLTRTICSKIEQSKVYGPLWKTKYGPLVVVNVANADLIEQVLRQEGRHPVRTDMPHWRTYRELRNQAQGPLTEWVKHTMDPLALQQYRSGTLLCPTSLLQSNSKQVLSM